LRQQRHPEPSYLGGAERRSLLAREPARLPGERLVVDEVEPDLPNRWRFRGFTYRPM